MADFDSYLNKKKKKPATLAEDFDSYIKGTSQTAVAEPLTKMGNPSLNPPSKSPFNPNTPGNQEFLNQLDMRAPSTSVAKNFFNVDTFKTAVKDVGSLAVGKESLPFSTGKTVVEAYTKPSEYTKEIEKSLPNSPLKFAGQAFIRTIMPLVEPLGEMVGGDIVAQREEANKTIFDSNIKPQTVGKQTQTVISDVLKTNKLKPKEVVDVIMASTNVGLLLAPFLTRSAKTGSLKLSQILERETKVPLTFSDLQKITSSTSNAEAISRVGQSKFFAYQEAAQSNAVRQALRDGFVVLAKKKPTTFSNIFKNIATRPITEAMNFGKTYGAEVKVPTTGLLPEKVSVAEAKALPPETLAKYEPKIQNGAVEYTLKAPTTPKIAPETTINPEVAKLPALDQKDYTQYIAPKEANLPAPKTNETRVYYGGDGKPGGYVDTQLPVALNRGVNEKTNVLNIDSSRLSSTGDPLKDARGERLLDVNPSVEGNKTSGIAKSINAKAIEQGLTSKGFDDLAEFNGTTFKEQAELVSKLDSEQAKAIVRGEQPLPPEIRSAALISAMEDLAKQTGDVALMQDLANSPLATKISESASELSLARMREQDSATMKLQEIKKARQSRMEKTKSKELQKTAKDAKVETEKVNLSPEEQSWDKFLTEIQC